MRLLLAALMALLPGLSPPELPAESNTMDESFAPGYFVATSPQPTAGGNSTAILGHVIIESEPQGHALAQAEELSDKLGFEVVPMVMYRFAGSPTDEPLFDEQWSLENRGQTGGVPDADIDAPTAWQWTTGEGAVIAVVDSGVDRTHADLAPNMWSNGDEAPDNGIDDDDNGFVDDRLGWDFRADDADPNDEAGHGTAVASVAAASANGVGMSGVAPAARLMPIRACDSFGCPASAVAAGIVYAVDNGATVVNLSLGASGTDPLVTAAVEYAADHDVLVVSAAGNGGQQIDDANPWTPASIESPNLVAVASSTAADTLSPSSNHGDVDLAAPGDQIVTASLEDGHEIRSGTSFAAPHVAGVAAMMQTLDPDIPADESAEILRTTSEVIAGLQELVTSGGRLEAPAAVAMSRFRDILESEFTAEAMWAATTGITKGCEENRFCPDAVVTRGQMAAFLRRALELPESPIDFFADDAGSIFEHDIDAIAAAGITAGCTETSFCPADPVTRGQMAAFIVRAFDLPPGPQDAFSDDDGSLFESEIDAIAAAGITSGCNPPANTSFCPEAMVTRGQMVTMLHRADSRSS